MTRSQHALSFLLFCFLIGQAGAQTINAVTNAGNYAQDWIAPGSIVTLWGANLANSPAQSTTIPLPVTLGGVNVFVNGSAVPLYFVSSTQIDFQLPYEILGNLPTSMVYINVCNSGSCGPLVQFAITGSAPGIFADATGRAIAQNYDGSLNTASNPASSNTYVTVYLTGIGALDNPVADGDVASDSPLSKAAAPFSASIGGVNVSVPFVGLTPGSIGLAQADIQVPDLPPGTYPVVITVGHAASSPASIDITGGSSTPSYVLTSIAGDGASGTPPTAAAQYKPGTSVPYNYFPASGFSAVTVEVDGTVSPGSGSVEMNQDHWLWAFGQPTTGTDFPGYITAPADPTVIPYPKFYTNRPSSLTVRVPDPYCAIQSSVIAYPQSYLGSLPMPPITSAPLPASFQRGMELKDYWNAPGFGIVQQNGGCGPPNDMHTAFVETVARVKKLGADHVSIVATPAVEDPQGNRITTPADGQQLVLDPTPEGIGISESDLAFIASTATQAGLEPWLDFQVCCVSGPPPNSAWLSSFLDEYTAYVVHMGQLAEKYGFKSMMLNWGAWFFDATPFSDVYATKMAAALTQLRNVFHGKVRLADGVVQVNDPGSAPYLALYNSADIVMIGSPQNILTSDEDQNLSFPLIKQKYKEGIARIAQRFAAFPSKPLAFITLIQSHRHFLQAGWIEDSFCVNNCIQQRLQTDFSVQANGYEALLEAMMESGLNFVSIDPAGYWYVDVIQPKDSFPNTSQSVRNKPAEVVLQNWYRR